MTQDEQAEVAALAHQDNRLSQKEMTRFHDAARARYAYERGWYEHALQPHWGIGPVMNDVVTYAGADREVVAEIMRAELDSGDEAAEEFLAD